MKLKSWETIQNELPTMRTVEAMHEFFNNNKLTDAQKGCLLYRITSNERFITKEEFERFLNVPKSQIIYLMKVAELEYNSYLLENKENLYMIHTVKNRMKKLKDIPFEELPRPFKKIDEFLELIPKMTAVEIWREFKGNINLTKAEEGLCVYYLAKLEKIEGLAQFIEQTGYSKNQIYFRLQHLKKVYGTLLIEEFLSAYKELSTSELLDELRYNILLSRKEHGLIFNQIMLNERFEMQKELIEKYGFNSITVSVALKEAKKSYGI